MANNNALSIMQRRFQDEQRRKILPLPPRRIFPQPPPTGGQPMPVPAQRRKSGSVTTGEAQQRPGMGIGDLASGAKNGMQIYQQMWGMPPGTTAASHEGLLDAASMTGRPDIIAPYMGGPGDLAGMWAPGDPITPATQAMGAGGISPYAPGAVSQAPLGAAGAGLDAQAMQGLMGEQMGMNAMGIPALGESAGLLEMGMVGAAPGVAPAATGAAAATALETGAAGFGAEAGMLAGMGGAMPWLAGAGLLAKLFGTF